MIPSKSDFTKREWRVITENRNPAKLQRFLRRLPYNRETDGPTCLSFRGVIRNNRAHCLEAAVTAAVILEQHGYPPLLVSIESADLLDHVLFLFKKNGYYGAVARSRDLGLHGRKPLFRSVRNLVLSYFDPYIDLTGRITGYGVANLEDLGGYDWRLSTRNIWKVERFLQEIPHRSIRSADSRYHRWRRRYVDFKRECPDGVADYYPDRWRWLL